MVEESHAASMSDFSALIDAQLDAYRTGFDPGEKVTGMVIDIGDEFIVVDLNAKREGIIARQELEDADGQVSVKVGDELTAYFVTMRDGAFLLSTAISGAAAEKSLRQAVADNMPVEGLVKGEINGGYEITVGGRRAFCPYSQMDIHRKEPEEYVGRRLYFMVSELDETERNVVLSRRDFLERERAEMREQLKEEITVGTVRAGVVSRIAEFGVFVDLGGIDGLVPLRELTWDRNAKPEDIVQVGEQVTVLVQQIDWESERISLSLRYARGNPWEGVGIRYPVGLALRVTVTRLMPFGAFAELEPGVEGLLHISKLGGGRRLNHAREVLNEGDELEVEIESVDAEQQRIGLRPVDARLRDLSASNEVAPGARVIGIVNGHREFGVFVQLNETQTGLLHISETRLPRGGNPQAKLEREYPAGSELDVVVTAVDGERVSLTLPAVWQERQDEAQTDVKAFNKDRGSAGGGLGSLADAFDGLKLG